MISLNQISDGVKKIPGFVKDLPRNTKKLLRETSSEMLLVGLLGGVSAATITGNYLARNSSLIPLTFSEIQQIERTAEARGEKVGHTTRYLAHTSDSYMKIFECYNHSIDKFTGRFDRKKFARELEDRMDRSTSIFIGYDLYCLLPGLAAEADSCRAELGNLESVMQELRPVIDDLDRAWEDSHVDHYRTEVYTVEVSHTDSNGNTYYTTEIRTRQVYDHTVHTYRFNLNSSLSASKNLDQLVGNGSVELKQEIKTATVTNADGEAAAYDSRNNKKNRPDTQEEFLTMANLCFDGSTLVTEMPQVQDRWTGLNNYDDLLRQAIVSSKDHRYTTYSHSDSGPEEFQINEKTLGISADLYSRLRKIFDGIEYTRENAPVLEQKIRQLIAVELDNQKGNPKKITREILSIARNGYEANFEKGVNTSNDYLGLIFLAFLLGGMAGVGAGYGLDKLGDRFDWYKEKDQNKIV